MRTTIIKSSLTGRKVFRNSGTAGNDPIIQMKGQYCAIQGRSIILFLIFMIGILSGFAQSGYVTTTTPTGGFEINGKLLSNYPTAGHGDWCYSGNGTGGGVVTSGGVPINSSITFHISDLYDSGDDEVFTEGAKFDQNPTAWAWTTKKANDKDEINNALVHFAYDQNGHAWLMFAGDRQVTNGDSYIDFEILQNTITATGTSGGGFSTEGPDGGRTLGDIVISLHFTNGGGLASPVIYRWVLSGTTYTYESVVPPAGSIYDIANTDTTKVPFGAFGSTSYVANQFAEAAVDLTSILGSGNAFCSEIKTIFIKTKSSASGPATLKDMVMPIQVALYTKPQVELTGASICNGKSAILTPTVQYGSTPYTYLWNTGATTASVTALTAGNYTVTVTSANSCAASPATAAVVTVFDLPVANLSTTHISCHGDSNGQIVASGSGGGGSYTYQWSNQQTGTTISGLTPGTYVVTITDANNCTNTSQSVITEPSSITVGAVAAVNPLPCGGATTTITVSATGGTPAYAYSLTGSNYQTSNIFTNQGAGTYTIYVQDSHSCPATTSFVISLNSTLSLGTAVNQHVNCHGESNGQASATASGGAAPFNYSWSNGQTGTSVSNLAAGLYSVTVTDANGCQMTGAVTISEPELLGASISNLVNVSTYMGSDGSLTVSATGGTPAYSYLWSNGKTTQTITGLVIGTYYVTATDTHGCFATTSGIITQPDQVCLDVKAFLQGPYDPATGLMWDSLRVHRFIPKTEPYSDPLLCPNFTHTGGGGGEEIADTAAVFGVTGSDAIVDWAFLELRNRLDSTEVLYTRSALLQRDGDIVDVDGVSPVCFHNLSDYRFFVVVRHRNHFGVMTANPVTLTSSGTLVNFANGSSADEFNWGNNAPADSNHLFNFTGLSQAQVATGVRALWYGDIDNNGKVKYEAPEDDQSWMQSDIFADPIGNSTFQTAYDFMYGYFNGDVDLSGKVKFEAPNDDRSLVLYQVVFYPLNVKHQSAFDFVIEQLPVTPLP